MRSPSSFAPKAPDCDEPNQMALALRNLQQAVEQCADVVFVTDHAGIITRVNPAFEQLTGYSSLDIIGTDLSCAIAGGAQSEGYRRIWEQIFAQSVFRGPLAFQHKGGGTEELQVTITPLHNRKGIVTHLVGTGGLTGAPDRMIARDGVAGLAHELNNILMIVAANAEAAAGALAPENPVLCKLQKIKDEIRHAAEIVRELFASATTSSELPSRDSSVQNACEHSLLTSPEIVLPDASVQVQLSNVKDVRHHSSTLLVVDDDALIREATAEFLSKSGYRVLSAASAEEALKAVQPDSGVQLVVTDVVLPRMSGTQLARQLATTRPGIKVLLISGYAEKIVLHDAKPEPDIYFLQKPFSSHTLGAKVEEILAQRQQARAAAGTSG